MLALGLTASSCHSRPAEIFRSAHTNRSRTASCSKQYDDVPPCQQRSLEKNATQMPAIGVAAYDHDERKHEQQAAVQVNSAQANRSHFLRKQRRQVPACHLARSEVLAVRERSRSEQTHISTIGPDSTTLTRSQGSQMRRKEVSAGRPANTLSTAITANAAGTAIWRM